jgi:hypothetical protein
MYGFIFVPYDNGQYSVSTNWAKAEHMIGFDSIDVGMMIDNNSSTTPSNKFDDVGDLELFTLMFKAEGVGSEINDFLDNTTFFASWAQSKTHPNATSSAATGYPLPNPQTYGGMLGSTKSETGSSIWLGANMPCPLTKDGRFGVEWNKGSKWWRSVTYGEDTMAGSKIAARGTALEVYYNKPIDKALSFNLRYTKIKYDYTGSNGFFGADGQPMDWTTVAQYQGLGYDIDPVKEATDLRASISYRF